MKETREPLYFNIGTIWYKGNMPEFYDNPPSELNILCENFSLIKKEIEAFYTQQEQKFQPQYIPYKYKDNEKWKVLSFYGFLLKHNKNLNEFPVLTSFLEKIPHLVTAQISVLSPNTKIKGHFAGSNGIIRSHLGIYVPGTLPQLGIRVKSQEKCWEEGKIISFCESHRHNAWNFTEKHRIILLIDTIHPDYIDKKYFLCGGMLSMLTLKMITHKFPSFKKMSIYYVEFWFFLFNYLFIALLKLQEKTNVDLVKILTFFKFKK